MTPAEMVRDFHDAFDLSIRNRPVAAPVESDLRTRLLREEVEEYYQAIETGNAANVAQELADIVYVAYGAALTHGIDLDPVIAEVHRANMSKIGPGGKVLRRADGKIMKGPWYKPPHVAQVIGEAA